MGHTNPKQFQFLVLPDGQIQTANRCCDTFYNVLCDSVFYVFNKTKCILCSYIHYRHTVPVYIDLHGVCAGVQDMVVL